MAAIAPALCAQNATPDIQTLDAVLVTAQKRAQAVQDVAIPMTVFGHDHLAVSIVADTD